MEGEITCVFVTNLPSLFSKLILPKIQDSSKNGVHSHGSPGRSWSVGKDPAQGGLDDPASSQGLALLLVPSALAFCPGEKGNVSGQDLQGTQRVGQVGGEVRKNRKIWIPRG